jgi:hypothetical protein
MAEAPRRPLAGLAIRLLAFGFGTWVVIPGATLTAAPTVPCAQGPLVIGDPPIGQCTPTPQPPTPTPTPTRTRTPSPSPTVDPSPSPTRTVTVQPSPSLTPTRTGSPTASPTRTTTGSPTTTQTPTRTGSPTGSPTTTQTPTRTGSPTQSPTPTTNPTITPTPTFTAGPPPTQTPTPKDPCEKPPPGEKTKRYAIGYTKTTAANPWKGASVVWSNERMWVPQPPLGERAFVDETLWIGTESAYCWIEVGDGDAWDDEGVHRRRYYWAEQSRARGYDETDLDFPIHPEWGRYQYYAIEWHERTQQYFVTIGGQIVAEVKQGGDTLFVHVGLETTDARAQVLTPVKFSGFKVFDGKFWKFWPTHGRSVDPPAWWRWSRIGDTAMNGIPFFILPPFPPIGGATASPEETSPSDPAKVFEPPPAFKPVPDRPSGGPYIDAETVRLKALASSKGRGAVDPRVESVRFMTYGEAAEWYGTNTSTGIDPYREVYVVYVRGRVNVGHHVRESYDSSYYFYDATTARLIQFGATDLPEPLATGQPYPR